MKSSHERSGIPKTPDVNIKISFKISFTNCIFFFILKPGLLLTAGKRNCPFFFNRNILFPEEIFSWQRKLSQHFGQLRLKASRNDRLIEICEVSSGGMAGTVADPKLIFSTALKAGASSIILSHNHPSGNLKPSQADIALTQKIIKAGSFLDIAVLDHIIITSEGYYSFADEALL